MTRPILVWEERKIHVRPDTHLSVRESDPQISELLRSGRWQTERHLRAWMAVVEPGGGSRFTHYLGSLILRGREFDCARVRRLLRRLLAVVPSEAKSELRNELRLAIRRWQRPPSLDSGSEFIEG